MEDLKNIFFLSKRLYLLLIAKTFGFLFKFLGGVYVIKYILRKKPYYIVLNYHNFSKYNNYKIKRGNILETDYSDNFDRQIFFLKKHFSFLYPSEFFKGKPENGLNIS